MRELLEPPRCCAGGPGVQLIANMVIVVTGGAVRLTGSGLGCPTWPTCTDDSYMTTRAMGYHGVIEFGNRPARRRSACSPSPAGARAGASGRGDRRQVRLGRLVLAGIPAQVVLGGITVLTDLNPWAGRPATSCSRWR